MIGDNIKKIRKKMGLSQMDLANKVGISHEYLNKIENLKMNNPSSKVLNKIANALNVPVDKLYKESKELSLEEILKEIYKNAPETDWPISALIVKQLIEMDLINEDGSMSPQVQKLLTESIALQSKLQNITKKKNG